MFLERQPFISRAGQQLWPLPTVVIPGALAACLIASQILGATLIPLVVVLLVAQISFSLLVWTSWRGTREQLTGVRHELSSLLGIVDVSRAAIIGVSTDGVIISGKRGLRGMYEYTSKEALGSPISILFDHRRGQEASLLFEKVARGENVVGDAVSLAEQ